MVEVIVVEIIIQMVILKQIPLKLLAIVCGLLQETPSNSKVISSYENAPIVWLAERNWEQWPTKWEKRETATHILVSNLDAFWTGSSEFNHATLTLEVAFQHHTDWLYLYTIEERP